MDNTLLDADKTHILAYNKAFVKYGLPVIKAKRLKKLFGIIGHKLVRKLFPMLSMEKAKKICDEHHGVLMKETKRYVKPFKGVKRTLEVLKKKYKIGVISNCRHSEIILLLKTSGINPRIFDTIIGNDDVKRPKPAPDEILKAEKLVHVNAAYMVGDTIYDIIAGKRAGVKTIGVLTGNQSRAKLARQKPWKILKSINGLPKVLGV